MVKRIPGTQRVDQFKKAVYQTESSVVIGGFRMKKIIVLFAGITTMVLLCAACAGGDIDKEYGETAPVEEADSASIFNENEAMITPSGQDALIDDLPTVTLGEAFYTKNPLIKGKLLYTINSFRWSDNIKDLDVDFEDFNGEYNSNNEFVFWDDGNPQIVPNAVDAASGQLGEHLIFVVADVTVTNEDAVWTMAAGPGDSQYTFPANLWRICDAGTTNDTGVDYAAYYAVFYTGTENYDAAAMGTNGSNYLVVRPGETINYKIGYIIGNNSDDFSHFYLTDGNAYYDSDIDTYIYLDIPGQGKG